MAKCIWCGQDSESLPLPEIPELFGLKSPHKVICPYCAIKEAGKAASFAAAIEALKQQEEKGEK